MCVQQRRVDRRSCDPQARPSTSFVAITIDLPWRNFVSYGEELTFLYFWQLTLGKDNSSILSVVYERSCTHNQVYDPDPPTLYTARSFLYCNERIQVTSYFHS